MSEPLYERVGHEPLSDAELVAALDAYRADYPDEPTYAAVQALLRRQNDEAKERAKAEATGTTVQARRQARAEASARKIAELKAADLAAARRSLALEDLPRGVSQKRLDRYARKTVDLREPDGEWPTQEAVADALNVTDRAIRDVGWERVKRRAQELVSASGSGGTSG